MAIIALLQDLLCITDPDQLNNLDIKSLQNLPFHFYWKDLKGKYQGCNDTQAMSVGFDKGADLFGATDFDLIWAEYAPMLRQNDQEVIFAAKAKMLIEPATGPDGKELLVHSYKMPLFAKHTKKILGIIGASFWLDKAEIPNSMLIPLTQRQTDCLHYLAKGMTIKRIANTLKLSPKTIEHYLAAIKVKLNCHNRAELIAKAIQMKII